ncbi:MAG: YkgJ family cysteine cluster protein [Candidatus Riflebacteria bacterium]|nr:YkgJ family cysteine cluster protein [Candidatus Riflebacteria bacterium]
MNLPCDQCATSCCKKYTVFLSAFDIFRLWNGTNILLLELVSFLPASKASGGFSPFAFSLGGKGRFLLTLRRNHGICAWWSADNPGKHCTVHEFRPDDCRCYPFNLFHGQLKVAHQKICPTDWSLVTAFEKDFTSANQRKKTNFFQYQALLQTWHEEILPELAGKCLSLSDKKGRFLSFFLTQTAQLKEIYS